MLVMREVVSEAGANGNVNKVVGLFLHVVMGSCFSNSRSRNRPRELATRSGLNPCRRSLNYLMLRSVGPYRTRTRTGCEALEGTPPPG